MWGPWYVPRVPTPTFGEQFTDSVRSGVFLKGKNKDEFLSFVRVMLQWRPEDRKMVAQLLQDPWLNG